MTHAAVGALNLSFTESAGLIAALLGCIVLYLAYKVFYRPDFGMPVRRRLLGRGLRVKRDQYAEVPIWWSNIQVQRAIKGYWKQSLRRTVNRPGVAARS